MRPPSASAKDECLSDRLTTRAEWGRDRAGADRRRNREADDGVGSARTDDPEGSGRQPHLGSDEPASESAGPLTPVQRQRQRRHHVEAGVVGKRGADEAADALHLASHPLERRGASTRERNPQPDGVHQEDGPALRDAKHELEVRVSPIEVPPVLRREADPPRARRDDGRRGTKDDAGSSTARSPTARRFGRLARRRREHLPRRGKQPGTQRWRPGL